MKKFVLCLLLATALLGGIAGAEPYTGRTWEYLNFNVLLSPDLTFTVMPGHRWEFFRSNTYTKDTFFYELFVGPNYTMKLDDSFKLKLSLWYYYMLFPNRFSNTNPFTHNIEVVPTLDWKASDRLTISDRIIFHNTVFSSCYATDAQQAGYSLMIREMVTLNCKLPEIDQKLSLLIGDEIFVGLVEDTETVPSPIGFYRNGVNTNRLYIGFSYAVNPNLIIVPQYVYETNYNTAGALTEVEHYFFLTITYLFKAF